MFILLLQLVLGRTEPVEKNLCIYSSTMAVACCPVNGVADDDAFKTELRMLLCAILDGERTPLCQLSGVRLFRPELIPDLFSTR